MNQIARYTVLRLLVFFGAMCVLWLCGLRSYILFIAAALVSTVVSYFALNRFRQQTVDVVQSRVEARQARAREWREAEDDEE